tara:strand:+ start:3058 stop:3327 length:270 start_codon:yes stop_codon:yes gene_type:complete
MGNRITIYVSEPSMAILNEMEGVSASSKVSVALANLNLEAAQLAHRQGLIIEALKKQIKRRNDLLLRIGGRSKITQKLRDDILDITELI